MFRFLAACGMVENAVRTAAMATFEHANFDKRQVAGLDRDEGGVSAPGVGGSAGALRRRLREYEVRG